MRSGASTGLLPILWALSACETPAGEAPADTGCPPGRVVSGQLTGTLLGRPDVYVAALDASSWRLDKATAVSDLSTPDPSTGAFSLCLSETVPVTAAYAKAFVAAWQDLDGDGAYATATEALCDTTTNGETTYLFYGPTPEGEGWTVGIDRAGFGALSGVYSPVLDGAACR